jgi:hypothetical protein
MFRTLILVLGLLVTQLSQAGQDDYLQTLVSRAQAMRLAQSEEWRALVHYRPRLGLGALHSMADSPIFFTATEGATNPQAELESTLAAFFSDSAETRTAQNPQCQFIARYHWLRQKLEFDPQQLIPRECKRFNDWRNYLDPAGVALVFPAAFLNNPASMFGHTFLRIDGKGQNDQSRLLAQAINFMASTEESSGILYTLKGLMGGYAGSFSHGPYYEKVREYNDLENRDMWEYQLRLTPAEIDMLLMHAWELGPVAFDYFYLDENCSYNLLALLDVARPSLRLADRFPGVVIPGDTVRAVASTPGFVQSVSYRPARSSVLLHRQSLLTPAQIALAGDLAWERATPTDSAVHQLPEQQRAQVLDLAFEYLEYLRLRGTRTNAQAAPRLRTLLAQRSTIDALDIPDLPAPLSRPEQGHESWRVSMALGTREQQAFQEFRWRPAYQDLMDPDEGFIPGAQIEFLNTVLREYAGQDTVELEHLTLLSVASLTPQDQLLQPRSWRFKTGATRTTLADGSRTLLGFAEGGVGVAARWTPKALAFAMAETSLLAGCPLASCYSLGAGTAAGVFLDATPAWRIGVRARAVRYFAGDHHTMAEVSLEQRWRLTKNTSLHFDNSRQQSFGNAANTSSLVFNLFF